MFYYYYVERYESKVEGFCFYLGMELEQWEENSLSSFIWAIAITVLGTARGWGKV